mmetsp:Transcript_51877/g.59212  ORF Transcript_51877/g.59212 Transcript_51877/m.59212 type:complete len:80 (-) Transcript_51877:251-490(-)
MLDPDAEIPKTEYSKMRERRTSSLPTFREFEQTYAEIRVNHYDKQYDTWENTRPEQPPTETSDQPTVNEKREPLRKVNK